MTDLRLPPFTVTPAAVRAIEDAGGAVRIDLAPGGCCGTWYAFERVDLDAAVLSRPADPADGTEGATDSAYGCAGAWLVVSPAAAEVLRDATLDHGPRLRPPRFRVLRNPNVTDVCPCRRSFGRPWPGPGGAACRSYEPMPWDETFDPPAEWRRRTGWSRTSTGSGPAAQGTAGSSA